MAGYNPSTGIYSSLVPPIEAPAFTFQGFVSYMLSKYSSQEHHSFSILEVEEASKQEQGFSPRKFRSLMHSLAHGLASPPLCLQQGEVVLLVLPSSIYVPVITNAILFLGAIVTAANPLNTRAEIERQAKDSKARLLFTTSQLLPKVSGPCSALHLSVVLVGPALTSSSSVTLTELLSADPGWVPENVRIRQSDAAVILYSSGTTGGSKGVVISHGNLISSLATWDRIKTEMLEDDDICLCSLPMFHIAGFMFICCTALRLGPKLVLLPRYNLVRLFQAIERYRVTRLLLVPPVVIDMLKFKEASKYNLGSLKTVHCGAAPLGKVNIDSFMRKFPHVENFVQGYGMTETVATGCAGRVGVGRLMPCFQAKVIDPRTEEPLPPNHAGELCLRGPTIMQGYLNNLKATQDAVDVQGWFHTGDLVKFDTEGNMFVVDRIKEMIKYNGFQVAPGELEALLHTHPQVLDCAVVPYPDERSGQVPHAFVVRKASSTLSAHEVMEFVAAQVAPYKKVRKVTFIDNVPKSPAGKILRRQLAGSGGLVPKL